MEESKDNKMTENQLQTPQKTQPDEQGNLHIQGHIKIFDPTTQEVYVDKRNAIHYENFSIGLAQAMSNQQKGFIGEMAFGNGGSRIDPTGIITYLTPNAVGLNASLYNQTYIKNIDANNVTLNLDPARNFMEVRHITGTAYTDILVSCLLDFGEPNGQQAFDTSTSKSDFVFDEIGLKGYSNDGPGLGMLLTHVIFHPVQKSLNRLIQIDYTVRIQSLTNGA